MIFAKISRTAFSIALMSVLVLAIPSVSPFYMAVGQSQADDTANEHNGEQAHTGHTPPSIADQGPSIQDPKLAVNPIATGINFPTSMAFLGPNDILVLEKDNGTVRRIINGEMQKEPLLDVAVANNDERGMLGMAVVRENSSNNDSTPITYVLLYYTESGGGEDGDDWQKGIEPAGNRLYRYELQDDKLTNPKLLLDLPATPGPRYNGGPIIVGQDGYIYLIIGDVEGHTTKAQNFEDGPDPDGTSGILKIDINGEADPEPVLGNEGLTKYYFAYGIRNSFGLDFDPVTGTLWDTENGPAFGDEINRIEAGFNSGWRDVQGLTSSKGNVSLNEDLVDFGGRGKYSDPEFTWAQPVGPTAIKFLDSEKLGRQYEDDMFVGDVNNGVLYHFDLDNDRTALVLDNPLDDKVADIPAENQGITFGRGFGGITDIDVGPDGYLYVLSYQKDGGAIFRISPKDLGSSTTTTADGTMASSSANQKDNSDVTDTVPLTVNSVDLDGKTITGLYTEIKRDGNLVMKGFTPLQFDAVAGSDYDITVADYKNYRFDHWDDGSNDRARNVVVVVVADEDNNDKPIILTAHYNTTKQQAENEDNNDKGQNNGADDGAKSSNNGKILGDGGNCISEKNAHKILKTLEKIFRRAGIDNTDQMEKWIDRFEKAMASC